MNISPVNTGVGRVSADGTTTLTRADLLSQSQEPDAPRLDGDVTREKFQEFVAGTFFQQMFKAMRSTQQKPKYFHGGQAEEVFQSQLDQQFAEELAKSKGAAFSDSLYDSFAAGVRAKIKAA